MPKKRNYTRYKLKDKGKVVYVGITRRHLSDRVEEHRTDRKHFTSASKVGPAVTKPTAEKWEEQQLARFRKTHAGRNPLHNKTDR